MFSSLRDGVRLGHVAAHRQRGSGHGAHRLALGIELQPSLRILTPLRKVAISGLAQRGHLHADPGELLAVSPDRRIDTALHQVARLPQVPTIRSRIPGNGEPEDRGVRLVGKPFLLRGHPGGIVVQKIQARTERDAARNRLNL